MNISVMVPVIAACGMLLSSCEGKTGCMDTDHEKTVAMLTDGEWLMVSAEPAIGDAVVYDDETTVYMFVRTGTGWVASGKFSDPSVKTDVRYFQWSFTTENFTVIQMAGNASEGFLLIKRLTSEELWVQWTAKDPVLVPNQIATFYKLRKR